MRQVRKVIKNQQALIELAQKIDEYNDSVTSINEFLETMKLARYSLPTIDCVDLPKLTLIELPAQSVDLAQVN